MALYHRRFRIWPQTPDGAPRETPFVEGVLFSDGLICVRFGGNVNGVAAFRDRTVESLVERSSGIFTGPAHIEWLDGRHRT